MRTNTKNNPFFPNCSILNATLKSNISLFNLPKQKKTFKSYYQTK